jgi:hypothetical protein
MQRFRNKTNGDIAVYDTFMSLWYVAGKEEYPYNLHELLTSGEWEEGVDPTIVKCECLGHQLEHQFDKDDNFHYISFWTHGAEGEYPSLRSRISEAWKVLLGKKLRGFWGVVLSDENAQKIARSIKEKKQSL